MRRTIRPTFLILLLGSACPSWAQDTTKPAESGRTGIAGIVYRCSLADGRRRYTSKVVPGAECVAISRYSARPVPSAPPAPGWTYLISSPVADTYVQSSSIKRTGGKVGAWVMENYKEPQTNNFAKAPYQSAMRRLSVKCDDRQITPQKTTFAAEPFGRGDYVGEWRPLGAYGDFATPGSIDDAVAAYVCRSK